MRKTLMVAATTVLVLLPTTASAITDGTADTGDEYPFVGLLAFFNADGDYMHRCSGTLLSDTIVLTAGHCTDGTYSADAYFTYEVPDDFRTNRSGEYGMTYTNPRYNPRTIFNDVGVVDLAEPYDAGVALPELPGEGFLSDLKKAHEIQDDTFVNVGYGLLNGWPPPNLQANEDRWYSESPYGGLNRNNLHLQDNHNATGGGGTCFGDSGGPHFWGDTLVLVSVTSWGDAVCRSNDMTQRTDIAPVLDWLEDEFGVTPSA